MKIFILIMFIATANDYRSGGAAISQEFNSEKACLFAGKSLVMDVRGFVQTWGCFPKSEEKETK